MAETAWWQHKLSANTSIWMTRWDLASRSEISKPRYASTIPEQERWEQIVVNWLVSDVLCYKPIPTILVFMWIPPHVCFIFILVYSLSSSIHPSLWLVLSLYLYTVYLYTCIQFIFIHSPFFVASFVFILVYSLSLYLYTVYLYTCIQFIFIHSSFFVASFIFILVYSLSLYLNTVYLHPFILLCG